MGPRRSNARGTRRRVAAAAAAVGAVLALGVTPLATGPPGNAQPGLTDGGKGG